MDPITIAMLIAAGTKAAKGIASGIQGRNAAGRQEEFLTGLSSQAAKEQKEAELEYRRLREQGLPQYKVGSSYQKYLNMAEQDPVADYQRRIAAQQEASNVAALRSGGARALIGGLSGVSRASADARQDIEAQAGKRYQDALETYAKQEQSVMDKNIAEESLMYRTDLQRALTAANAARQAQQNYQMGMFNANEQRIAANNQFLDTGIDLLGTAIGHTEWAGGPGYGFGGGGGGANATIDTGTFSDAELDYMMDGQVGERGMKVSKTPGPFSHAKNPIHIVRNGRKIGEMTGGEVILNPDQEKKVASQSPYFRQLLRKFNQRNK